MRRRTPARSTLPPFTRDIEVGEPRDSEGAERKPKRGFPMKKKGKKKKGKKKGPPASKAMMGGPFASAVMAGK
jgi:hypothetical protein